MNVTILIKYFIVKQESIEENNMFFLDLIVGMDSSQDSTIQFRHHQDVNMSINPEQIPLPDPRMQPSPLAPRMQHLNIMDADVRCEYVCSTMYKHTGVILQFVSNMGIGSSSIIGGIRLKLGDISQVPAYLSRYKQQVKQQAVRQLHRHMLDTQCAMGLGEVLTLDDYGISFMAASLTQRGYSLHPFERNEGPLFFCLFPGLVEPAVLRYDENGPAESAYIINVYINLLEPSKRRTVVAKRIHEEEQYRKEEIAAQMQAQGPQPAKKQRVNANAANKKVYAPKPPPEHVLGNYIPCVTYQAPQYPPLPQPATLKPWPETGDDSALGMPAGLQ